MVRIALGALAFGIGLKLVASEEYPQKPAVKLDSTSEVPIEGIFAILDGLVCFKSVSSSVLEI